MVRTSNAYPMSYRVMDLLDEKTTNQPVKVGGIASLLGTTVSIAEKTKDQNLFETVRGRFCASWEPANAVLAVSSYVTQTRLHSSLL